jgi:hypothetical protein
LLYKNIDDLNLEEMLKKKAIIPLVFLMSLYGCMSETEQQAMNSVAEYFDCQVSYSKGFLASTEEDQKYLVLTLSGENLDGLAAENVATQAALIMYKNMAEVERDAYTHLKVKVEIGNQVTSFDIKTSSLQIASQKANIHLNIIDEMNNQEYEKLMNHLDLVNFSEKGEKVFIQNLREIDKDAGKQMELFSYGFSFLEDSLNNQLHEFVSITYISIREKQNMTLRLVYSIEEGDDKIYGFHLN